MSTKSPNPTDRHVGARVRMRRMMLSMTQEKLGDALGLTFQQVQKYEKGANRIGASRLQQIAHILQVPVAFFFDGAPTTFERGAAPPLVPGAHPTGFIAEFLATQVGLDLVTAFSKLPNEAIKRSVVTLIERVVETDVDKIIEQEKARG